MAMRARTAWRSLITAAAIATAIAPWNVLTLSTGHLRRPWQQRGITLRRCSARPALSAVLSDRLIKDLGKEKQTGPLGLAQQLEFARNGHVCTRGLFSAEEIQELAGPIAAAAESAELEAWRWTVRSHLGAAAAEAVDDVEECQEVLEGIPVAFVQHFNLWRRSAAVKSLVTSQRLAQVAATLLGVTAVCVYQDALFEKRPGDKTTRWHADLHMAPFDTNDYVTCWIPLTPVASQEQGGTGLSFVSGSHCDLALGFWRHRPQEARVDLETRYGSGAVTDHGPLALGDATWHHGWTLHGAPGLKEGQSSASRRALAVSFIADGARIKGLDVDEATDDEDTASYSDWLKDLEPGAVAAHELLPRIQIASE